VGATVGTLTGLLLAPRSGRETRRQVQKTLEALPVLADDWMYHSYHQSQRWSGMASRQWQGFVDRCQAALVAGLEASREVQETAMDTVAVTAYPYEEEPESNPDSPPADPA